jgi:hypothetical protein
MKNLPEVNLKEELKRISAEPQFVWFLLAWDGLIDIEPIGPAKTSRPGAYQNRIKRQVQKDFAENWKPYWHEVIQEGWKEQNKIVLTKSLFWMQPVAQNRSVGMPRKENLWTFVFDLRNYFCRCNGKFNMRVIALLLRILLNEKRWTYYYLNSEFSKRRRWFSDIAGEERINTLLKFYNFPGNKEKIKETLRLKIPLYERFKPENKPEEKKKRRKGNQDNS